MSLERPVLLPLQPPPNPTKRIVKLIHNTFLQRNDPIVGDLNILWANFRAAFGDVAKADAVGLAQFLDSILGIEWMHLQGRSVNKKARADKFVVHVVIAQDVANILAKKTFNAFSKFLHAIDVLLLHPPGSICRVGRARLELLDAFFDGKIPRDIRD